MAKRFSVEAAFIAGDRMTKPLTKMQRRINKFARLSSRRVAKIGAAFKKTGAVMGKALVGGIIVAGAAVGLTIKKTAELGDEAAKTSRRLGITAETLQEYRFAADRQGVSNSMLATSFTALQKRVGELKSGTGSLFAFLKRTGDTALFRQLQLAKDTGEAFEIITKRAATIEDPLKKAAFAAAAFSRTGVGMINVMEAGVDGIAKLRKEARKYGAVISNQAAAQSEVFIDSLTNLKSSLTGVGKTFSTKLIPFLSSAMQRFADFWALNKQIIGQGMDNFLLFIGKTFVAIKPGVIALFGAVKNLFTAFSEAVGSLLPEFKTETDDFSTSINFLTGTLKTVAEIGAKAFKFIAEISPFIKPLITTFLIYQGILIAIGIATRAWAIVQGILNAVMSINPITVVILAIAALVAVIIFLVQNWDFVVVSFKSGVAQIWDFLSGLLDNPFIAAAGLIFAPFIAIPALIIKHWEPIKDFFLEMWNEIKEAFSKGIAFVTGLVNPFQKILSGIGSIFGELGVTLGGETNVAENSDQSASANAPAPQVVTQSQQLNRIVEESRQTAFQEVLIRDETGRAEISRGSTLPSVKLTLASSGGA